MVLYSLNNISAFYEQLILHNSTEAYLEPCQTSKMEHFTKTVNSLKPLTIFANSYILDVWQGSLNTPLYCIYLLFTSVFIY